MPDIELSDHATWILRKKAIGFHPPVRSTADRDALGELRRHQLIDKDGKVTDAGKAVVRLGASK